MDAITSFSQKPLKLAGWLGFALSIGSFVYLLVVIIQKIVSADSSEPGWASIVAITLFFNGIILIILGVIGQYIGRIYDESKNRPIYIIKSIHGKRETASSGRDRAAARRAAIKKK